jgi:hypothetical protein
LPAVLSSERRVVSAAAERPRKRGEVTELLR